MKNIATALVKAQKAFGPALKSSTNPHFKSRYADLSACVEAVIEGLNEAGIALIQRTSEDRRNCIHSRIGRDVGMWQITRTSQQTRPAGLR